MRACSAFSISVCAALLLLDLAGAGQQRLEVAILADELRGGLHADAGHAGHVVDGVAGQRLDVDDVVRADAEFLDHLVACRSRSPFMESYIDTPLPTSCIRSLSDDTMVTSRPASQAARHRSR